MSREDEHRVASFFARAEWREVRPLVERISPGSTAAIEALVLRVRLNHWRDFSPR